MLINYEVITLCVESVWKVPGGKCVESAWEVLVEAVLEVVGSAELSANTCKTAHKDVLR